MVEVEEEEEVTKEEVEVVMVERDGGMVDGAGGFDQYH